MEVSSTTNQRIEWVVFGQTLVSKFKIAAKFVYMCFGLDSLEFQNLFKIE